MNDVVLVRYGEIALKSGPVRREFKEILIQNMESAVDEIPTEFKTERGRIFVETPRPEVVASEVANLPGVVSSSPARKVPARMEEICESSVEIARASIKPGQTFAVRARRTGKHQFSSKDIEEEVGRLILEKVSNISVDLDSPDQKIYVEVRGEDAYIFDKIFRGIGGLPVGSQGGVLAIFRERVHELVSSYLLLKRGCEVSLLAPVADRGRGRTRVLEAARGLLKFHPKIELHLVPIQRLIEEISEEVPENLRWIVCRRGILKLGKILAKKKGCEALAVGGSPKKARYRRLQIAKLIECGIDLPILRPLFGFNDEEILKEVEKITDVQWPKNGPEICPWGPPDIREISPEEIQDIERDIQLRSLVESMLESTELHKLER